ncbi:MAG: STAS domain-containing protein [Chloroflexi bacterium]|nr:STAS domain-containing protein [Chloroflexota bacterium]
MEIITREFKHCDLVEIKGRLDSSNSQQLNEKLNEIMEKGRYKIILDLAELDFISSAGLRVLVNTQKTCKRYNRGEVILTRLPSNIKDSLDLVGFTTIFKIFDDVISAVGNF